MAKRTRGTRALRADKPAFASTAVIRETGNADISRRRPRAPNGEPSPMGYPAPAEYLEEVIAPPPVIDRYPLRIGSKRTIAYLSSVIRLCTIGYRMQFVDLLDELLEQDPHAYGVLQKRVLAVAQAKMTFTPADMGQDAVETEGKPAQPSQDQKLANEICQRIEQEVRRIRGLKSSLVQLCWGVYYGISCAEIHWTNDVEGWHVSHLAMVHSRRLAYPEWSQWRLYIWDQGPVSPWESASFPTQAPLGLCVDELPGKFITYCPPVRGDYPTREGLGLELSYWLMTKHIGARGAAVFLERFGHPVPEAVYKTPADPKTGEPRKASKEDIAGAQTALNAIGGGTVRSYVHPDTVELKFNAPEGGSKGPLRYLEWMQFCDAQMSKAVLGGTLSTEIGETGGANAAADTQHKDQTTSFGADSDCLGDAFGESVVYWLVKLNYPAVDTRKFMPQVALSLEEDPDPNVIATRACLLAAQGYPVDARALEELVAIPLVDPDDKNAIVMMPIKPGELVPPVRPSDPEKQAQQVEDAADIKATPPPAPVIAGPGGKGLPGAKKPNGTAGAAKPAAKPAPKAAS